MIEGGESVSEKLSELERKTDDISNEDIETEEDSISIEDNNGIEVFHLDENGLDAKNVKSNGRDVLTEHQDISEKQDKLYEGRNIIIEGNVISAKLPPSILEENTDDDSEKIILGESEDNPVVIIEDACVKVKKITDLNGNPIGCNEKVLLKKSLGGVFKKGEYITSSGAIGISSVLNSFYLDVSNIEGDLIVESSNLKSNGTILWAGFKNELLVKKGTSNPDDSQEKHTDVVDVTEIDTLVVNCLASGLCDVYTTVEQEIDQVKSEELINNYVLCGKNALFLGDSIMQGIGSLVGNNAVDYIKECLRFNTINGGIGGTTMRDDGRAVNLVKLVDAIIDNDWTGIKAWMDAKTETDKLTLEMKRQYSMLYSADVNQIDLIFIAYGFNDWNGSPSSNVFDDVSDKENTTTTLGSLRNSIKRIQTKYPHIKIFVATPGFATLDSSNTDLIVRNGKKLWELGNEIEQVCRQYHIPCLNQYYINNVNEFNSGLYLRDGVHRNAYGYKHMGYQYAKFIMYNF